MACPRWGPTYPPQVLFWEMKWRVDVRGEQRSQQETREQRVPAPIPSLSLQSWFILARHESQRTGRESSSWQARTRQGSSRSPRATAGDGGRRVLLALRKTGTGSGRGRHETRTPDSAEPSLVLVITAGRATSVRPLPPRTLFSLASCIPGPRRGNVPLDTSSRPDRNGNYGAS